ncbi:(Fe-S)-binding protein [Neobacillus sp. YIM B06451]|uniref:(Fe-S)-binding protein n=1 Tax=Neobacillus sp. YIM B06451 TaxID=3070994 RepID=UPI002930C384|nr:(Fe-S)-binding protein [Neobacillus sp. YIM B06451]
MTTVKEMKSIERGFKTRMDEDELLNCMRCGFCLPSCPTYIDSGFQENHSPRGRIALMKAVADGLIEPDEGFERSLDLCLGCRACETVCPSGVRYGSLLEEARDIIASNKTYSLPVRVARKAAFSGLFPHQNRMRTVAGLIGFYQRSGLQTAARKIGFMSLLPEGLASMEKILPDVPPMKELKNRPDFMPASGEKTMRVAFFRGCLMDTMFLETNNATIKLLQLAGCDVVIPKTQACCGALHGHYGEKDSAMELAKRNIEAFEGTEADYIISNAGGCGGFLVEYGHLFQNDAKWRTRAESFSGKVKDLSEILIEAGFLEKVKLMLPLQIVTYQDSCHLRNAMKSSSAPRALLMALEGAEYREMDEADRCCGSAGIYNILESEMSMKVLDYKMDKVKETHAATIVTANPGCLLQMKLGIEREGLSKSMRAVHIADLLLEAVAPKTQAL